MIDQLNPLGWTNLEQARILMKEGLDVNTADMAYYQVPCDVTDQNNGYSNFGIHLNPYPDFMSYKTMMTSVYENYKGPVPIFFDPCWSLGTLINLLPEDPYEYGILIDKKNVDFRDEIHVMQSFYRHKNLIANAVEAIVWCLQFGYLEKKGK